MRATLANALTAPAGNPAVTIMLDQSMNTEEGGKTRLANVVAALDARIAGAAADGGGRAVDVRRRRGPIEVRPVRWPIRSTAAAFGGA